MFDLLIINALIYDGTGSPAFMGHVAVKDGKIAGIFQNEKPSAAEVVDAQGCALSPGFIDVHSHSDSSLEANPHRLHVLRMGVTTEVAGQCGGSRSPAADTMTAQTREFLSSKHANFFPTMAE